MKELKKRAEQQNVEARMASQRVSPCAVMFMTDGLFNSDRCVFKSLRSA